MRRTVLLAVLWLALLTTPARAGEAFTCLDGLDYTPLLTLTLPVNDSTPDLPEVPAPYFITALAAGAAQPLLHTTEAGEPVCTGPDPLVAAAAVQFSAAGPPVQSPASTLLIVPGVDAAPVALAESSGAAGEFVLLIEGGAATRQDGAGDVYELTLAPALLAGGPPVVYALALDADYDPALALLDDRGRPRRDDANVPLTCDNAGTDDCYGDSVPLLEMLITATAGIPYAGSAGAAMLTLPPESAAPLRLRVEPNGGSGRYLLVLHVGRGLGGDVLPAATLTESAAGVALDCAGVPVFADGVQIDLPPTSTAENYRAVVLSDGVTQPALAVFTADGTGTCYQSSPLSAFYSLSLPDLFRPAAAVNAGADLPPGAVRLVFGSAGDVPGDLTLVIEGYAVQTAIAPATPPPATLPPQISGDVFGVRVAAGMANFTTLTAYMIATVNELNPFVAQVDAAGAIVTGLDGTPAACDDAGQPLLCQAGTASLEGALLTQGPDRALPGFGLDAMLRLGITPDQQGQTLRLAAGSAWQQSQGGYVLVINISRAAGSE